MKRTLSGQKKSFSESILAKLINMSNEGKTSTVVYTLIAVSTQPSGVGEGRIIEHAGETVFSLLNRICGIYIFGDRGWDFCTQAN